MSKRTLLASIVLAAVYGCTVPLDGAGGDPNADGGLLGPTDDSGALIGADGGPGGMIGDGALTTADGAPLQGRPDSAPPPPPPPPPAGAGIPCDVAAVLAAKCTACHSDPPVNGSLSGLVTLSDLLATSKEDGTQNEAQLSLSRMKNAASPMPPASIANPPTASDIAAFQNWITANYMGSCGDAAAPPPPPSVFAGAPAFVSSTPESSHNAGQNCMGGCHDHGFTFAGTLTNGAGAGISGAEVRLVDSNGTGITVHTGSNGNFHSSTSFVGAAHVGARNATTTVNMVGAITNGGCASCHISGGTTTAIHLP